MKKSNIQLTTAQFAKLHEVNKRTLHYYDNIGFFSPNTKGENGYRYYDLSQSIDFEYIRMLKELNMSIEEIEAYYKNPAADSFLKMANSKIKEIDAEIQKMKAIKRILNAKIDNLIFCEKLGEQVIKVEEHPSETLLVIPYDFSEDDVSEVFGYLRDTWSIAQIRMGIGGFISLDKVIDNNFEKYDGLYTPALCRSSSAKKTIKPKGKYLCGYQKGTWDQLPSMYKKMLAYANQNHLSLTGYAYEIGLNEFAISDSTEYVTKIMIMVKDTIDCRHQKQQ